MQSNVNNNNVNNAICFLHIPIVFFNSGAKLNIIDEINKQIRYFFFKKLSIRHF